MIGACAGPKAVRMGSAGPYKSRHEGVRIEVHMRTSIQRCAFRIAMRRGTPCCEEACARTRHMHGVCTSSQARRALEAAHTS